MLGNQIHESEHTLIPLAAAGATTLTTDVTVPEGAKSVEVIVHIGATVTVDANSLIKISTGDKSDHSDTTEVTALTTAIVAGMASKHVRLELAKPRRKYFRVQIIRGGGADSVSIDGGDVIVHGVRKLIDPSQALCFSRAVAIDP